MTSQLTSLTQFLHDLTPQNQRVAIAAVLGVALGIPVFRIAARDYHGYLALGPGGLPHNVVGWLGQMLLKPLRKEPFGTSCYDETAFEKAGPNGHVAFLSEKDVPVRQAPRPVLGSWAVPSRQVSDLADKSIIEVCIMYHTSALDCISSTTYSTITALSRIPQISRFRIPLQAQDRHIRRRATRPSSFCNLGRRTSPHRQAHEGRDRAYARKRRLNPC